MNRKILPFISFLAIGVAAASFVRAADETISAVVPPDSSTTPEPAPTKKGQDGKRMQGMLDQRLKQLDDTLKLTDDQKQKIKDIWAKQAEDLKNLSPQERRTKGREAMKTAHDEVRAVLTPEQQTKFDSMPTERPGGKGRWAGKKAQ